MECFTNAAFSSLKFKMVETFNYLKGKINNFFESVRWFLDNLSEKLNNLILSTKNLIETVMSKILKLFGSILHGEKKGLNDEMKSLTSYIKLFMSYIKDVEEETGKGYKSSWNIHDYIILLSLIPMVLGFVANF